MMLTAAPALAITTVIFDDFDGLQTATDLPTASTGNTSSQPFGAGERILEAENVDNNGIGESATTLTVAGGSLSFSNDDGATGRGTLTYTNVGDIELGPDPFFLFDVGFFDNDAVARFEVVATDTGGGTGSFEEILSEGFSPQLFFSEFSGSVDFNSISTLSFTIDSADVNGFGSTPNLDGSLNAISIGAVPLPAGGLLLLSALGGAAVMKRRKDRKAA